MKAENKRQGCNDVFRRGPHLADDRFQKLDDLGFEYLQAARLERLVLPRQISARLQNAVVHELRAVIAVLHFGNLDRRRADINAKIGRKNRFF